jgi:molybdenum cofactor biosynthesis enzyme MoaA
VVGGVKAAKEAGLKVKINAVALKGASEDEFDGMIEWCGRHGFDLCLIALYMCLGQDDAADLRTPLRATDNDTALDAAITEAIARKPKGHDFVIDRHHARPAVARYMSVTGG